jgi:hypothetical protein
VNIKNTEGLSPQEVRTLVSQGGKFVVYKYCISIIVMTFNNPTDIYFIKPNHSRITPAIGFLFINFILGWWGIPWGPIYTLGNIGTILGGGKDVTNEVMAQINQGDPNYGTGTNYNIPGHNNNNNASNNNTYNVPGQGGNSNANNTTAAPTYNVPGQGNNNANNNNAAPTYNVPR